ncbi:nuclear transport factor 2 family protein [Roseivirga sp. E12]|uniref:nuclear transport factor 2 family protein n=1 Tax=Roseivirga sp. E12 TaxID=2819237 RepID=UPI001ABCE224|nr:nuclear transport factor 2 family protein [Roseivirga sp. E12]MBO3696846.1 nuclear transport factor 2 family protein [Roseivirga sp. E12]
MNSKETVQAYFSAFGKKEGWEKFADQNIVFEGPMPKVVGKQQWVEMTQQFTMGVTSSSLDSTITENDKVALTATYNMTLPTGDTHSLKTMEVYTVRDEKINHILISFDTATFNEFMAKMPQPNA